VQPDPNLTDDPFITTAAPERNAVRIHNQEIYHQSFTDSRRVILCPTAAAED